MSRPRTADSVTGSGGQPLFAVLLAGLAVGIARRPWLVEPHADADLRAAAPLRAPTPVTLHIGWTQDVGQPQPVHRHPGHRLHAVAPQLRLPRRLRRQDARPQAGAGDALGGLGRRPDLDVHDPQRRHVAGRRAGHGQGRRLHVQLHHREPPAEPGRVHRRHHQGRGRRRHHGGDHDQGAQGQHAAHGRADPAGAHLEQGRAARTRPPPTATRRRSSATGPSRSWSGRRASS